MCINEFVLPLSSCWTCQRTRLIGTALSTRLKGEEERRGGGIKKGGSKGTEGKEKEVAGMEGPREGRKEGGEGGREVEEGEESS